MMLSPKVGEHWYVSMKDLWIEVHLCKVLAIKGDVYTVGRDDDKYKIVSLCDFLGKWEPNWFWKLLGYK